MTLVGVRAAVAVELRKTVASRVVRATTVLYLVGVTALSGLLTLAAQDGNPQILAQLGPLATEPAWLQLTGVASQVCGAGGMLAFGVVLSWSVGREFTEGTIAGLFAIPIPRPAIALAKLLVVLVWSSVVAGLVTVSVAGIGMVAGLGFPDTQTFAALGRLAVLGLLTGLVVAPAAWAATLGRSLLPGIAAVISVLIVGQLSVVVGTPAWLPFATPAWWSLAPDEVSAAQLGLVAVVPAVFWALTLHAWQRLQLDR